MQKSVPQIIIPRVQAALAELSDPQHLPRSFSMGLVALNQLYTAIDALCEESSLSPGERHPSLRELGEFIEAYKTGDVCFNDDWFVLLNFRLGPFLKSLKQAQSIHLA